jgi:hypothetical protein
MVLEGAPASLADLARRRYPLVPLRLLMRSPFDAIRIIDRIPAPILFLHATHDEVIPLTEGRRLFERARGAKAFVEVQGGHVNAIERDAPVFEHSIRVFLEQNHVLAGSR